MTARQARVGLTQRVVHLSDRDERRDALAQAWVPLLEQIPALAIPIPNRLTDPVAFVRDMAIDLLILTGGNDLTHLEGAHDISPERDHTEGALLAYAEQRAVPVLGVCRGMQMLVHHHGGSVERVDGHVAVPHLVASTASGSPSPPLWPVAHGRTVNSFHGWGVRATGMPSGWHALATAPDGTIEAVAHPTLPLVGIMWHPERPDPHPADLELIVALLSTQRGPR